MFAGLVQWIKPGIKSLKINVDGSFLGNLGRAGIGGLVRDETSRWITGFFVCLGVTINMHVELAAIH